MFGVGDERVLRNNRNWMGGGARRQNLNVIPDHQKSCYISETSGEGFVPARSISR